VPAAAPPRAANLSAAGEGASGRAPATPSGSFAEGRRDAREALAMPWIWADSPSPPTDVLEAVREEAAKLDRERKRRGRAKKAKQDATEAQAEAQATAAEAEVAAGAVRADQRAASEAEEQAAAPAAAAGDQESASTGAAGAPGAEGTSAQGADGALDGEDSGSDSDSDFGPMPLRGDDGELMVQPSRGGFGGAMRPGEGQKIAAFVQAGKRVPRRGEVAWSGEEITKFEASGYVMSGSRNVRMNEVRLRKENQVFNAEEKRAMAMLNWEQEQQRQEQSLAALARIVEEQAARPLPVSVQEAARARAAAVAAEATKRTEE
ncbi:unnamed protein product, partial [Symbiodinium sp. KB8]